jgi:hypothetical protein
VSAPYANQATYYRTGLLLGLVDGVTVHDWAQGVIEHDAKPPTVFFELVTIDPADLTAQRLALWPLVVEPDPPDVLRSILGQVGSDLMDGRRSIADTLTVLRQMRSMLRLPPDLYEQLNVTLVAHASDGRDDAIAEWLRHVAVAPELRE